MAASGWVYPDISKELGLNYPEPYDTVDGHAFLEYIMRRIPKWM
jgi:hypothetical protein